MQIRDEKIGAVRVVAPVGRIDSNTCGDLERSLRGHAGEGAILVDLLEVEYISSAGLSVLLKAASAARASRGRLVLCSLRQSVREVFALAGFTAIFTIEPSRAQALDGFAEKPGGVSR
jgi:anti-sigma B factor antagonist